MHIHRQDIPVVRDILVVHQQVGSLEGPGVVGSLRIVERMHGGSGPSHFRALPNGMRGVESAQL